MLVPRTAVAEGGPPVDTSRSHGIDTLTIQASKNPPKPGARTPKKAPGGAATQSKPSRSDRSYDAWSKRVEAYKRYQAQLGGWNRCSAAGCPKPPAAVPPPGEPPPTDLEANGNGPAAPTITPEQAAYVAIARLRLTPPKPVIGPSPDINEWHIAAVGYPYWLWADGNLDPAPVSTTVADLTVRLDAHLQSTTFDLGDGTRLTCTDLTHPWTPAVEPAAPSPVCGHTYTKPSLPKGKYKITAYSTWAVDWSVNGVGGTIPLYQQASTTVPVGELQVLTH